VRSFVAPEVPSRGLRFGRVVSGPCWPQWLPALDRIAPVPATSGAGPWGHHDAEVALYWDAESGRRPICAIDADTVRWAFDPAEWIRALLTERYVTGWTRPLPSRIPLINYSRFPSVLKGLLEPLQSPRGAVGADKARPFPAQPLDTLVEVLRQLCVSLASGVPPQRAAIWPDGRQAAVTLTHDVDVPWVLSARRAPLLQTIVDTETRLGYRGAWYVTAVALRASRHGRALRYIADAGHEIGSHGWNHDGKLNYVRPDRQRRRVEKSLARLQGLGVSGIRTPWYCRSPQLFEVLSRRFSYDTSVPNSSAFFSTESNSGCCTIFPYEPRDGVYELPMTLPPDTSLDRDAGYAGLMEIVDRIVDGGGVVVVVLHPQPHQSANAQGLRAYFEFLRQLLARHGDRLWHATPCEIVQRYRDVMRSEAPRDTNP
jgi:peptidoglycan/xylan/chitin deacetylase (PgdA/CDA1 family)